MILTQGSGGKPVILDPIEASKQGLRVLINELVLQKRHQKMVRDQNAALMSCNRARFAHLHEQYVVLQAELEIQNKLRLGLFGTRKLETVISGWPDVDRRNAERVLGELRTVVIEVRLMNEQNRKLVGNQIKYVDFMMNLLISTYRKGCMYGPQGCQSINHGNLFINSAA